MNFWKNTLQRMFKNGGGLPRFSKVKQIKTPVRYKSLDERQEEIKKELFEYFNKFIITPLVMGQFKNETSCK